MIEYARNIDTNPPMNPAANSEGVCALRYNLAAPTNPAITKDTASRLNSVKTVAPSALTSIGIYLYPCKPAIMIIAAIHPPIPVICALILKKILKKNTTNSPMVAPSVSAT